MYIRTCIVLYLFTSCFFCKHIYANQSKNLDRYPYTILISIDGYRYDYNKIYKPKFLSSFANKNYAAKSLMPVYPSKTFPNHLSAVTGVYPETHGIVANNFYNPQNKRVFNISDNKEKFSPIWSGLQKKGIKTASYFWPGSDTAIEGKYPTYYKSYRRGVPGVEKVAQVINWLKLPLEKRPHFIALYFSDVDSAGHHYGPKSQETAQAIEAVDKQIDNLYTQLNSLKIDYNLIIISDHGMQEVTEKNIFYLDDYLNTKDGIKIFGQGSFAMLYLDEIQRKKDIIEKLRVCPYVKVYSKSTIPAHYKYSKSKHIGDIVLESISPYYMLKSKSDSLRVKGEHGYSPFVEQNMHGIFYAKGKSFRKSTTVDTFSITNVYNVIASLYSL